MKFPRCALLLVMFTFYAQKADTARCKHLLEQAGLPQLLLASISCRMKHADSRILKRCSTRQNITQNIVLDYSFFFSFPLLLSVTRENSQHTSTSPCTRWSFTSLNCSPCYNWDTEEYIKYLRQERLNSQIRDKNMCFFRECFADQVNKKVLPLLATIQKTQIQPRPETKVIRKTVHKF